MCKRLMLSFILFILTFFIFGQEVVRKNGDFEIDGKYHVLQYRANIRKEPTRNSDIMGIIQLHDRLEILDYTDKMERINNISAYWYKIRYGDIIGYIFGGNLARKMLATDIDKNGINDYFYFRFSYEPWEIDSYNDIIIYINNNQIDTNLLNRYWFDRYDPKGFLIKSDGHIFDWCEFKEYNDYVLIELLNEGRDTPIWLTIYKIDKDGRIDFFEWNEGYWGCENGRLIYQIMYRVNKDGVSENRGEW